MKINKMGELRKAVRTTVANLEKTKAGLAYKSKLSAFVTSYLNTLRGREYQMEMAALSRIEKKMRCVPPGGFTAHVQKQLGQDLGKLKAGQLSLVFMSLIRNHTTSPVVHPNGNLGKMKGNSKS